MVVEKKYYTKSNGNSEGIFVSKKKINRKRVEDIVRRLIELEKQGRISSNESGDGRIYFLGMSEDAYTPCIERRFGFQPVIIARAQNYRILKSAAVKFELKL
jgi:hypothetical protein